VLLLFRRGPGIRAESEDEEERPEERGFHKVSSGVERVKSSTRRSTWRTRSARRTINESSAQALACRCYAGSGNHSLHRLE
jgi:hypothetical protein